MSTKRALFIAMAAALTGLMNVAAASPYFRILHGDKFEKEEVGDAGGSQYPWLGGPGPGAGAPSSTTKFNPWPDGPGFNPDPSYGNKPGMSGWDTSYLWLSKSAWVRFQYMGAGDSTYRNQFWVAGMPNPNLPMFQDNNGSAGTNPCPIAFGATTPSCDIRSGGQVIQNEWIRFITVPTGGGYVPFWYVTGADEPETVANDGKSNTWDGSGLPGYMLGEDPYLAPGPFSCGRDDPDGCAVVYAALSDRTRVGSLDHDYSDMAIRISVVPEPGTVALLGLGLAGLAALRRRRA